MKKIILWLLAIPLVLIGGCYVTNLILFPNTGPQNIRIAKETTYLLGPLDREGFVDYVEALNLQTSQGVTPENNAVVPLLKALGPKDIDAACRAEVFQRLGMKPLPEIGEYFVDLRRFVTDHPEWMPKVEEAQDAQDDIATPEEILDNQEYESQLRPWSSEEFPAVAAWLRANEGPLSLAYQASQRTRFYWPLVKVDPNGTLHDVGFGGAFMLRSITRAMIARAMLAIGKNRSEEAWQDLLAVYRLSRLAGQDDTSLVAVLVSYSISGIADEGIVAFIEHVPIDREKAREMIADLRQLSPLPTVKDCLNSGERFGVIVLAIQIAKEGHSGIGNIVGPGRFKAVDWNITLEYLNELWDEVAVATDEPTFEERQQAFQSVSDRIERDSTEKQSPWGITMHILSVRQRSLDYGSLVGSLLLPAFSAALTAETRTKMQFELSILAIALAAYKHDHAEYPDALAELVPDYLDAIPIDLFTDKDLRYEKTADGYLLYSLGPNMKDDRGATVDDDDANYDIVVRVPSNRGQNEK